MGHNVDTVSHHLHRSGSGGGQFSSLAEHRLQSWAYVGATISAISSRLTHARQSQHWVQVAIRRLRRGLHSQNPPPSNITTRLQNQTRTPPTGIGSGSIGGGSTGLSIAKANADRTSTTVTTSKGFVRVYILLLQDLIVKIYQVPRLCHSQSGVGHPAPIQ